MTTGITRFPSTPARSRCHHECHLRGPFARRPKPVGGAVILGATFSNSAVLLRFEEGSVMTILSTSLVAQPNYCVAFDIAVP
jgi:hypothetical protein